MNFKKNEAWSFGKSSRSNLNKSSSPGPGNYDSNLIHNKSSPKWHFGQKYYNKDKSSSPGAGSYNIPTKLFTGPKYSLSKSHGKQKSNENPSPLDYNPKKEVVLRQYPLYSMRMKVKSDKVIDCPGPGMYNPDKKHKGNEFKFGVDLRFKSKQSEGPSPLDYNPILKNMKSFPSYSIRGKYSIKDNENNPGPGSYDINNNFKPKFAISKNEKSSNLNKNTNPGPGQYSPNVENKNKGITFKGRYNNSDKDNFPGPKYEYDFNDFVKKSPAYS